MSVSPTSSNAYHTLIKGDLKENGQDNIILAAFVAFGEPASARMIQKYLKTVVEIDYESPVMARSINNLHSGKTKEAQLVKVKYDHCKVTGVWVKFYEPILK